MKSLLIVDDQSEVRAQIRGMLDEASLTPEAVYEAGSVKAALEIARAERPSLLLLDVILPDGTGFDVLNRLQEEQADIPTVMMTAFPQFDYAMQAINSQVKGFLVKPLEINEFTRVLLKFQGDEYNQKKTQLAYTILHNYLQGQQLNSRLGEIREQIGINRLQGACYLALITSMEPSAALESRVMNFWALLRGRHIESVSYLQDGVTLVSLFRTDAPDELIQALTDALGDAFGYYVAGCSSPDADKGLRYAYQNAEFALAYSRKRRLHGEISHYEKLDVAQILVELYRDGLVARDNAAVEKLIMEFARKGVRPEQAAEALAVFCQTEGLRANLLRADSLGQLSMTLKEVLAREEPAEQDGKNEVRLNLVKQYIGEHFAENISRASIVEALGIGYSYVGDLFRNKMNMNVTDYIHNLKIQRAMELLANTRKSVSQIAQEVGYSDSKSFIRAFQKRKGCSPGEWRLQKPGGRK